MKNIAIVESYLTSRAWVKAVDSSSLLVPYVICAQAAELDYYLEQGVPADCICDISMQKFQSLMHKHDDFYREAMRYEKKFSVTLNRIISMDRILKTKNYETALCYLGFIAQRVDAFLSTNNISVIIEETTWAQDIVVAEVAKILKIKAYFPQTVRIPSARSCFLEYYSTDSMYCRETDWDMKEIVADAYSAVVNKGEKSGYFYVDESAKVASKQNIISLFRQVQMILSGKKNTMCSPKLRELVFDRLKRAVLRKILLDTSIVFPAETVLPSSYILIPLHVQPEVTIDVYGNTYANQIEFIQAISKTTPAKYKIVVKEHLPSVGCRPKGFYKELSKISGVILINPKEDSHKVIKSARMVISIAGTCSYEAALLGVPAVTASKTFFSDLMLVDQFNPYENSVEDLFSLVGSADNSPQTIVKKLESIVRNSFEGHFVDSRSYEGVGAEENVEKLRIAFEEIAGACC